MQGGNVVSSTRHRFSEFETLRKLLADKYCCYGVLVPQLPPKKAIGASDAESSTVKERMHGLTLFCEYIMSNPFLANDENWMSFLVPDTIETGVQNIGEKMLQASLNNVEQPFKFTILSRIDSIKDEVASVDASMRVMQNSLKLVLDAEKSLIKAYDNMHESMQAVIGAEATRSKCFNGYPFDATDSIVHENQQMKSTLSNADSLDMSRCLARINTPDILGVIMSAMLQNELSQMDAFRDLFRTHDEINALVTSLTYKYKAEEQSEKQSRLEDYRERLAAAESSRSNFYKGLIYFTLPMFARYRCHVFRQTYGFVSAVHLTEASKSHAAVLEFFRQTCLSPQESVSATSQVLDSLTLAALSKESVDFGRNPEEFAQWTPATPLLFGLFEAAISGNYSPLTNDQGNSNSNIILPPQNPTVAEEVMSVTSKLQDMVTDLSKDAGLNIDSQNEATKTDTSDLVIGGEESV